MSEKNLYLKQNIQVEPLINQWYAWIQIIPPANAAFNIIKRHLATMQSYINSPMMHAIAVKDPAMRGGPFIDLDGQHIEEVKALMDETHEKCGDLIAFTEAVEELQQLLEKKATGYSLEPLYAEVPEILKGYVELYYDLNHNPSFRFFESLLYKSKYFAESMQSIALSETVKDKDRPFIFTTPRLKNDKTVHLPIPFSHEGLDELFKMKRQPQSLEHIKSALGMNGEHEELFKSFFTTEKPPAYKKYEGNGCRIRYFGHACILLETKDISILMDPILSYTYESDLSRYTYEDLPDEIDYVLITHSHHDHILLETMIQLRHKIKNIVLGRNIEGNLLDPSLRLALNHLGFDCIRELSELETITFPGGSITGIPFLGEHHDLSILSKLCYYIKIGDKSVLSIADSCNIEPRLYEHVHRVTGDIDVVFLGMECDGAPISWVYGPLFKDIIEREKDHSRRGRGCNFQEGYDFVNQFNCKEIYVYAMGSEPWVRHILDLEYTDESNPIVQSNRLIEECQNQGKVAERLFAEKEIFVN